MIAYVVRGSSSYDHDRFSLGGHVREGLFLSFLVCQLDLGEVHYQFKGVCPGPLASQRLLASRVPKINTETPREIW